VWAAFPLLRFGSQHQSALQAYRRRMSTQLAPPDMNFIADSHAPRWNQVAGRTALEALVLKAFRKQVMVSW
jgi:hypothetical protein